MPRATTIVTNANIATIILNAEFMSSKVVNWSYTDRNVRFNFPVGVAYHSDPDQVRMILLDVARTHSGVLKDPGASVLFHEFGDSSLNFILRVWTKEFATIPGLLRSELYVSISRAFQKHGIEIPFPQRDRHIKSGTLHVRQVPSQQPNS
jgi:small-conductance mechanosensitive channel